MPERLRPYTPELLADRWSCSPNHVRNLIRRGELNAFRVGSRLLRISPDAVEEFERCQQSTGSEGSTDAWSPPSGSMEPESVIVLRHSQERKPRRRQ